MLDRSAGIAIVVISYLGKLSAVHLGVCVCVCVYNYICFAEIVSHTVAKAGLQLAATFLTQLPQ